MKCASLIPFLLGLAFAVSPSSSGQSKIAGTLTCKGDEVEFVPLGSSRHFSHRLEVEEQHCTWRQPPEIKGMKVEGETRYVFREVEGTTYRERGSSRGSFENDDDAYTIRWWLDVSTNLVSSSPPPWTAWDPEKNTFVIHAISNASAEVERFFRGHWTFTGGTGRLVGIRGSGTCDGEVLKNGIATLRIDGEYKFVTKK
jgi:hypothetical protein